LVDEAATGAAEPWDWDAPFPYGFPAAVESSGSGAAPFLAGFTFALIGLILPDTGHFRHPGSALVLLSASAIAFIATVQCAFWARQYAVTPEDVTTWRPQYPRARQVALQRLHQLAFRIWARRANRSYRAGIMLLLAGVGLALVPPGSISAARGAAIGVIGIGFVGELLWMAAQWLLSGSDDLVYDETPDLPRKDVRFRRLRTQPLLRRIARLFVPLARLERPPGIRAAGAGTRDVSA
jgi:hypothetical protein